MCLLTVVVEIPHPQTQDGQDINGADNDPAGEFGGKGHDDQDDTDDNEPNYGVQKEKFWSPRDADPEGKSPAQKNREDHHDREHGEHNEKDRKAHRGLGRVSPVIVSWGQQVGHFVSDRHGGVETKQKCWDKLEAISSTGDGREGSRVNGKAVRFWDQLTDGHHDASFSTWHRV